MVAQHSRSRTLQPVYRSIVARFAVVALLCLLLNAGAGAEPFQQRLPGGLLANADYHQGDAQYPAVLVLHGLLATHNFPTVQHIAVELQDSGYTVLTPTLTLGVSNRNASLPCTALQLHSMQQTVAELAWWVDWLADKGHRDIFLIGHSAGSLQILVYSLDQPNPAVRGQILSSLVSLERLPDQEPAGESTERARERLAAGDHSIARYDVSFCHGNFTSPPEVFLSYAEWDKPRVAQALRQTAVPTTVIMGGDDQRFTGTGWMPMLREATERLVILEGASHFFDHSAEFLLLDSVHEALSSVPVDG
jgi:pimeloyl-ACP methyl ester carboxylesterase